MAEATLAAPSKEVVFFVKQLNPEKHGVTESNLATAIQEIEIQTQILGASLLIVHAIDQDMVIQTSGLFKVDEDGLLGETVVEYPLHTGYFWELCRIEGSTEMGVANLILTFQDRIVSRLRQQWGHKTIPHGLTTRAQFVRALVEEANLKEHLNPKIRFVSPGVNRKEPVEAEKPTKTKTAKATQEAKENKERGIHPAASITIEGSAVNAQKLADINTALEVANKLNAGDTATQALLVAGIGESGFDRFSVDHVYGTHKGIWQSDVIPPNNVAEMAEAFLKGGPSFGAGGAIAQVTKGNRDPGQIATEVEVSGEPASFYNRHLPDALNMIHAGGGVKAGGTSAGKPGESDIGQLTRGTTTNPDEDSWDCIQRLAQEVNWFVFTDGRNTLYYMDGPDLMAQRPVLYIDGHDHHGRSLGANPRIIREDKGNQKIEEFDALIRPLNYTYDNTSFLYRQTHKVKQRLQRKSKIAKPQTPAEVRMLLIAAITEYRAGDVFVFRNFGPISENGGRWIVSDATRETLKYPYTKFILVPPTEPLPEPKASEAVTNPRENPMSAAGQAQKALTEKSQYRYVYGGGRQAGVQLFGPPPRNFDCSSFTTLCYKEAGLPDPNGLNYNPIGATQTMIEHMKKTSTPQPGDLAFFGTLSHTTHVNIVVGGGRSISMSGEGDPSEGPSKQEGPGENTFLGYWTLP